MRKFVLYVCLIVLSIPVFSQNNIRSPSLELKLNLNRPINPFEAEPKFGFGLEIRRVWFPVKHLNLLTGVIFKDTRYYAHSLSIGALTEYHDLYFNAYTFSIPALVRLNFGKTTKLFMEAGPEVNITPYVHLKASGINYPPYGDGEEYDVSMTWRSGDVLTLGLNAGAGVIIPIANTDCIISGSYHEVLSGSITANNPHSNHFTVQVGIVLK